MKTEKAALRRKFRELRRGLSSTERILAHQNICNFLRQYLEPLPPANLAAYWPMPAEVDITPIFAPLQKRGWQIFLPRVRGENMDFHLWQADETLAPNTLSILEPAPESPLIPPQEIHFLLLPLLAIDLNGIRLGQGGGYYDRFLPLCPQAKRIGLAYDLQVSQEPLPQEDHDQALPLVFTESGPRYFPY